MPEEIAAIPTEQITEAKVEGPEALSVASTPQTGTLDFATSGSSIECYT